MKCGFWESGRFCGKCGLDKFNKHASILTEKLKQDYDGSEEEILEDLS